MPEEFEVPAKGVIDYQYIPVPTHFTEDKWVEMAEVRPGDRSVVHHAIVVVDTGTGTNNQEFLAGYAPGSSPQIWKPGQARLIKAGATLVFQMHYATTGKASRDRTRIGLIFAKKPPTERIVSMQVMDPSLTIPPGNGNFRVDASLVIQQAVPVGRACARTCTCAANRSNSARSIPTAKPKSCWIFPSTISTGSRITIWKHRRFFPRERASSAPRTSTTPPTTRSIRIPTP